MVSLKNVVEEGPRPLLPSGALPAPHPGRRPLPLGEKRKPRARCRAPASTHARGASGGSSPCEERGRFRPCAQRFGDIESVRGTRPFPPMRGASGAGSSFLLPEKNFHPCAGGFGGIESERGTWPLPPMPRGTGRIRGILLCPCRIAHHPALLSLQGALFFRAAPYPRRGGRKHAVLRRVRAERFPAGGRNRPPSCPPCPGRAFAGYAETCREGKRIARRARFFTTKGEASLPLSVVFPPAARPHGAHAARPDARRPDPWRTQSGRCAGGYRRSSWKAGSRRQSADRPWGSASEAPRPQRNTPCRTRWSTGRCRR